MAAMGSTSGKVREGSATDSPRAGLAGLYAALRSSSSCCYWLDSAGGGNRWSRWSFAGSDPILVVRWREGTAWFRWRGGREEHLAGYPWTVLREVARLFRKAGKGRLPAVRALLLVAYDLAFVTEGIEPRAMREQDVPDLVALFFDGGWTLDHASGRLYGWREKDGRLEWREEPIPRAGWPRCDREAGCGDRAAGRDGGNMVVGGHPAGGAALDGGRSGWNLGEAAYCSLVERAKEYIAAGEVYQVNLSRRLRVPFGGDVLSVYLRLRRANPEPFGAVVELPELALASASPELFLWCDGRGRVTTRPIKGTRPRSPSPAEDQELARELLASEKDRAELLMIVDLERNDLGRVCRVGSVRVPALFTLETHPAVHHLVATVEGKLRGGCDVFDLLGATFPGGSVTGAPKRRAIEVIDELEPVRRGFYTGSLGYLGLDGSLELSILIRTIFFHHGHAYVHTGGGITAGSCPRAEFVETEVKAALLVGCLGQAVRRWTVPGEIKEVTERAE